METKSARLIYETMMRNKRRMQELSGILPMLIKEKNNLTKDMAKYGNYIKNENVFVVDLLDLKREIAKEYGLNEGAIITQFYFDYAEFNEVLNLEEKLYEINKKGLNKIKVYIYSRDNDEVFYEFDFDKKDFESYQTEDMGKKKTSSIITVTETPYNTVGRQLFDLAGIKIEVPFNYIAIDNKLANAVLRLTDEQTKNA